MATQKDIARRLGLDISSVNKILNRKEGVVFKKETVQRVIRTAEQLGYDLGRLKHNHRRKFERSELSLPAEVTVVTSDGEIHDRGTARIEDLSLGGAKLSNVKLPNGTFPTGAFSVVLRPSAPPLEGLELRGQMNRIETVGHRVNFCIEFDTLDHRMGQALRRLSRRS